MASNPPNNYSWDLGFNYSAALNDFGEYNLAMGFQLNGVATSSMIGITTGDNLFFNLFNIGTAQDATYTISGVLIGFRNALTGTGANCPISGSQQITLGDGTTTTIQSDGAGNATIQIGTHVSSPVPGQPSSIFGSNRTRWNITSLIPMSISGDFEVSISMTVQGPDGLTKIFSGDPEMVVGSFGGGPLEDLGEVEGSE